MSSVIVAGDVSGSVTLQAPSAAGSTVITLPATSGTMALTSVAPAFSVYLNTPQTIPSNTYTKIAFDTEDFDTNNNFDSTTNRRFTPTVAGYYQFNLSASPYTNAGTSEVFLAFYKNGSLVYETRTSGVTTNYNLSSFSGIIYCNGSTDYIEFYIKGGSQALTVWGGSGFTYTRASGFLAKGV